MLERTSMTVGRAPNPEVGHKVCDRNGITKDAAGSCRCNAVNSTRDHFMVWLLQIGVWLSGRRFTQRWHDGTHDDGIRR